MNVSLHCFVRNALLAPRFARADNLGNPDTLTVLFPLFLLQVPPGPHDGKSWGQQCEWSAQHEALSAAQHPQKPITVTHDTAQVALVGQVNKQSTVAVRVPGIPWHRTDLARLGSMSCQRRRCKSLRNHTSLSPRLHVLVREPPSRTEREPTLQETVGNAWTV